MAGKGVWGMIGVDMIGRIRRAYFEQRRSIKEIVRTLRVSRTTVRKVVRGKDTEFKYERSVQPAPKLGEWIEVLTAILETESKLPRRERRSTQRLFEELRGQGYDGAHDSVHRFVKGWRDERARVPAQAFVQMSSHDLIEPVACTPAAGWEKGQVENQVGNLRDQLFRPKPRVKSLAELNAWLEDQCAAYAKRTKHPEFKDRTIWEVFEAERS